MLPAQYSRIETALCPSQEVKNDETSHLFSQLRCAPDVLFSDECTGPAASPKCDRSLDEEHSRRRTARHHAGWRNWRSVESAQIRQRYWSPIHSVHWVNSPCPNHCDSLARRAHKPGNDRSYSRCVGGSCFGWYREGRVRRSQTGRVVDGRQGDDAERTES